jgi:hypothetical protein
LTFDPFGELLSSCLGNNAGPGNCTTDSNTEQWHTNSTLFIYSVAGVNEIGIGPFTFQRITAVPEPGTALLILAGLMVLAVHRARFWKRLKVV